MVRSLAVLVVVTAGVMPLSALSDDKPMLLKNVGSATQVLDDSGHASQQPPGGSGTAPDKSPSERRCSDLPGLRRLSSTGIRPPIEVFFNSGQEELAHDVLSIALRADKDLRQFFGVERRVPYQVFLAKDNAQFDVLTNDQRDWKKMWYVVGMANTENDNVIRDPDLWDPRSLEYVKLPELIKHEMAHSFAMTLNGKSKTKNCALGDQEVTEINPYWFDEGLATLVSGQLSTWKNRVKYDFEKYPHFEEILDYGGYATAGTAVEFFMNTFGRESVLEAIRKMPGDFPDPAAREAANRALFDVLGLTPESKVRYEAEWKEFALKKYPRPKK